MKSKITLTEDELINFIDILIESSLLNQYDEEDFIDVFLEVFKPWVKEKMGQDVVKKYPLSKLVSRNYNDFLNEYGLDPTGFDWMNLSRKMAKVGKELVIKGVYKLPTMQPTEFFTKKNEKVLSFLINSLELPPWVEILLEEKEPYHVKMKIKSNWMDMITSEKKWKPIRANYTYEKVQKVLKTYLGIETQGKPIYGELDLDFETTDITGVDDWVKNTLNKEIKTKLKKSDVGQNIHSVAFKVDKNTMTGEFKIRMKSHAGWSKREPVKTKLKNILEEMGYNIHFFDIEI